MRFSIFSAAGNKQHGPKDLSCLRKYDMENSLSKFASQRQLWFGCSGSKLQKEDTSPGGGIEEFVHAKTTQNSDLQKEELAGRVSGPCIQRPCFDGIGCGCFVSGIQA